MMMLLMSVKARSHGSGVGDCARCGGKGGVGCLEIHITFVKCRNWTSESIYKGVMIDILFISYFAGVP